jgi:hypothetical protein
MNEEDAEAELMAISLITHDTRKPISMLRSMKPAVEEGRLGLSATILSIVLGQLYRIREIEGRNNSLEEFLKDFSSLVRKTDSEARVNLTNDDILELWSGKEHPMRSLRANDSGKVSDHSVDDPSPGNGKTDGGGA